ncbi:MAG: hypothetical protein BWK79_04645, partial [Beggiatoa sp. IS2]
MSSEKGKIFLKFMVRAMVYGLKHISKQILGADVATDLYKEWQKAAEEVRQKQEEVSQEERIARLEGAARLLPQEARAIAGEVIVEIRQQGQPVPDEQANMVLDLASTVPALIRERTQATLRQARNRGTALHAALPIGEGFDRIAHNAFYQSLFPCWRLRFHAGEAIPHRIPTCHFVQLLGIGGFGEVWEVRHPYLPDHFAVKFCQDELSAKVLKREAQALIALSCKLPQHPNIAQLLELQLDQEPYWLAFELVTGGTLEALLRTGPLSWAESLKMFRPLVVAMTAVHEAGIVHRDLKPANILLTVNNVPKIADFGIGKVLADNETEQRQTRTRFTSLGYGSVGYMSEEQMAGETAHPADDTFALGVLLWQMLSGSLQPPPRHLRRLVGKLNIPQPVQELIVSCVDEPRSERPQKARVLLAVLESLAQNRQKSVIRQPVTPEPQSVVAGATFCDKLKDGSDVPEMVLISAGKFMMGS